MVAVMTRWASAVDANQSEIATMLLLARRRALIGTLRHLRRKHRSTCDAMADLQSVTLALLAQGEN